jgi:hypothetical protein
MCGCSSSLALVALELEVMRHDKRADEIEADEFASYDALPACCAMSRTQLLARARATKPAKAPEQHSMERETA